MAKFRLGVDDAVVDFSRYQCGLVNCVVDGAGCHGERSVDLMVPSRLTTARRAATALTTSLPDDSLEATNPSPVCEESALSFLSWVRRSAPSGNCRGVRAAIGHKLDSH
jgi:hypothetical protein